MRTKLLWFATRVGYLLVAFFCFIGLLTFLFGYGPPWWSQEASGWAQAIGSVIAICSSFYLFKRERDHEKKKEAADDLLRRTRSVQAIQDVAFHSIGAVYRCIESCKQQPPSQNLASDIDRIDELRAMLDRFVDPRSERIVNLTAMLFSNALYDTKTDYQLPIERRDDALLTKMLNRHGQMLQQQIELIKIIQTLERQCRALDIDV